MGVTDPKVLHLTTLHLEETDDGGHLHDLTWPHYTGWPTPHRIQQLNLSSAPIIHAPWLLVTFCWLTGRPSFASPSPRTSNYSYGWEITDWVGPICVLPLSNNFMCFPDILIDCSQLTSQNWPRNRFTFNPFYALVENYTSRKPAVSTQ